MKRRDWIKLKSGIFEPRHVKAIGPALWIFGLMLHTVNWETGIVSGWTDSEAATTLGLKPTTARDWRQRLVKFGYISCEQAGRSLEVQIHNWTNPREYSGAVTSRQSTRPADVGDGWADADGDVETEPSTDLSDEGSVSGSVQGSVRAERPFIESHLTPHTVSKDETPWVQVLAILRRGMDRAEFDTWVQPTELLSLAGDMLTVAAANAFGIERLEKRHRAEIEAAASDVIGRTVRVRFVVVEARDAA